MRGKPFEKGDARAGRRAGSKNKRTIEVRDFAKNLVEDPDYVENLTARMKTGKAPHMETLLFHYAFGKPIDRVEHTGKDGKDLIGALMVEVVQARG